MVGLPERASRNDADAAPTLALAASQLESPPPRWRRRLSPSALERYRSCPRLFFHQDVRRAVRRLERSPQLAQANAIHRALERFYGLEPQFRTAAMAADSLRSVWCEERSRDTFASREEEAQYGREALAMLDNYCRAFSLDSSVLAREQWLEHQLPNGVTLFGKVDRIDRLDGIDRIDDVAAVGPRITAEAAAFSPVTEAAVAAGYPAGDDAPPPRAIEIVDYKTGRCRLEPNDLPREMAVQVYLLIAESAYGLPVERVRFLYLAGGKELSWSPEAEDRERIRRELLELTDEILERIEFPGTPGDQCRFCPVALSCPDRQRVQPEEIVPVEGLPF